MNTSDIDATAERRLATFQAARLSRLTGVSTRRLLSESLASLSHSPSSAISPDLLQACTVSGRIVSEGPGAESVVAVPHATVHADDTDYQLLGFFPRDWPWAWYFPLYCRREEIASAQTDADGRFMIRIPQFDVNWILRWRHGRLGVGDLFQRVERNPTHASESSARYAHPLVVRARLEEANRRGHGTSAMVRKGDGARPEDRHADDRPVWRRAFATELPPPLPENLARLARDRSNQAELIRALAARLDVSEHRLEGFDLGTCYGPFRRSPAVQLPEWTLLTDVPDITFRVRSETDAGRAALAPPGNFDVPWAGVPLPEITLRVLSTHAAGVPEPTSIPPAPAARRPQLFGLQVTVNTGGSTTPRIVAAGYSFRPHRSPLGRPTEGDMSLSVAAAAPFANMLQLYGDVRVHAATYYRVLRSTDQGATFRPLLGVSWPTFRAAGSSLQARWTAPDADGWYSILPADEHWFPGSLLMEWPIAGEGAQLLRVECADAARRPIGEPSTCTLEVDVGEPRVIYHQLSWKFASEPDDRFDDPGRNLLVPLPTIRRGTANERIQIRFAASASARHFRYASLGASGCGNAEFMLAPDPSNRTSHWYAAESDEPALLRGRFQLDAGVAEGAYSFNVYASGRRDAESPASGGASPIYVSPTIPVAIVR